MNDLKEYIDRKFAELKEAMELNAKQILTTREAAKFLGLSVDRVYRLAEAGTLPSSRPNGKHLYFSRKALEAWMLGQPRLTTAQLKEKAGKHIRSINHLI